MVTATPRPAAQGSGGEHSWVGQALSTASPWQVALGLLTEAFTEKPEGCPEEASTLAVPPHRWRGSKAPDGARWTFSRSYRRLGPCFSHTSSRSSDGRALLMRSIAFWLYRLNV